MTNLLKKNRHKIRLTDNDMLLMIEEAIRGGICHPVHIYAKANNKYIKIVIKTKNHHNYIIRC